MGLSEAAVQLGLNAELKLLDLFDLRDHADLYLPAIVAVEATGGYLHYVTIHKVHRQNITVMDPVVGLVDVPFDELWAKIKPLPLPVARKNILVEEKSGENSQEILARMESLGIPAVQAKSWMADHSIFLLDDCVKYLEVMDKADTRHAFGATPELMEAILNRGEYDLPDAFRSGVDSSAGHEVVKVNSPLVLVVHGPAREHPPEPKTEPKPRARLLRLLGRHFQSWFPYVALASVLALLGLLFPLASGWVIDSLDLGWPPLMYVLLAVGLTRLFNQYATYALTVGIGRLKQSIAARLKSGLLLQFQKLPEWMMMDRMPGELMTRLGESAGLSDFVTSWGLGVFASSLTLVLAVLLMIRCWWPILLLSGVSMVLGALVNEVLADRLRRLSRDVLESSAQFDTHLMELFRGLDTIRLTQASAMSFFASDPLLAASIRAGYRQKDWNIFTQLVLGIIEGLTTVGLGLLTYWGLSHAVAPPGAIITAILLSTMARASLSALLGYRKDLEHQGVVLDRYEEFLDTPGIDQGFLSPVSMEDRNQPWQDFQLEGIDFSYGRRGPVLDGLSLVMSSGKSICLLGESGAGKSTLMDVMCGLLEPDNGRILLDGRPVDGRERQQWGVLRVEQEPALIESSIRDNLLFGLPDPGVDDLVRVGEAAALMPLIDSDPKGWDRRIGGRSRGLSGGEIRRLCLARALLRRPGILLLDETLSAVDWRMRRRILANLHGDRSDRTVLLATHDPSDAFLCDEVIVLDGGKIVETGTADQLFADPETHFAHLLSLGGYAV